MRDMPIKDFLLIMPTYRNDVCVWGGGLCVGEHGKTSIALLGIKNKILVEIRIR